MRDAAGRACRAIALAAAAAASVAAPALAQVADPVENGMAQTRTERPRVGSSLARRPDERRPASPFTMNLFGRPLTVTGEYEVTHENRQNFDLDRRAARNRARLDQELQLELFHRTTDDLSFFFELVGVAQIDTHRSAGHRTSDGALERGQMWFYKNRLLGQPLALQGGRVALVEPRAWWWDEDLDAVRVFLGEGAWLVETGIGQEAGRLGTSRDRIAPEQEHVTRWFGRAAYEWRARHTVEAYWLRTRDRSASLAPDSFIERGAADPSDARLSWLGARLRGEERLQGGARMGYWLDTAWLRGQETLAELRSAGDALRVRRVTEQDLRGRALDAGVSWRLGGSLRPTFTAAYARGSGDRDPADGVERSFRQTGLQENKGRFGGVSRFRYYGELLRPELSNLEISTLAFGFRFLPRSSLDLVLHRYRQNHASRTLASDRLDAPTNGTSRSVGSELDLILGIRESARFEYTAKLGLFRAGSAFGARANEEALFLELGFTWVF